MPRLTALKTSDESWAFAGFPSTSEVISLRDVDIVFDPLAAAVGTRGLFALGFDQLPTNPNDGGRVVSDLAGIPVFQWHKQDIAAAASSSNTCESVDHVVIHTNAALLPALKLSLERQFGITLRKERTDIYPGVTQLFFRDNNTRGTVMEVIVMPQVERTHVWGVTLVARDLDLVSNLLGEEGASKPKKAVQPGRRILTVRPPRQANTHTNMAFMTPHVSKSSKL